jgi:hypothetical protein
MATFDDVVNVPTDVAALEPASGIDTVCVTDPLAVAPITLARDSELDDEMTLDDDVATAPRTAAVLLEDIVPVEVTSSHDPR